MEPRAIQSVDSDLYRGGALYPRAAAYSDSRIYVGTGGNGMLVVNFAALGRGSG
jgi:hypothetical protein